MILIETPITKRQITIYIIGPSPPNLTPFDLPFKGLKPVVVTLSVGTPPPDSVGASGES
jgi:hypothetical protein